MKVKRILTFCFAVVTLAGTAQSQALPASLVEDAYSRISPAVCIVSYSSDITNPSTGQSSKRNTRALGLLVSPDGMVMAHGHMELEDSEPFNIKVTVGSGELEKEYDAKLLKKPEDVNICFLKIQTDTPTQFPFASFATEKLNLGEEVAIIGLLGETLDFSKSVIVRHVGAILEKPRTTYCIDERLLFGYVGGPVINASGKVIGVIGFDLTPNEGGELYVRSGHPLIYQTDLFERYIKNPPVEGEEQGSKEDAFLGVFTQPLTDDLAEYWNLPQKGGVVVGTVIAASPAEAAGLKLGDVIVSFNNVPVTAKLDRDIVGFTKLVRDTGVGKPVPVKLIRDGQPLEISLTLTPRPKSAKDAGEFEDKTFGLTVREITTDVRILLNLSEDVQGVIVRRVKSGSWAELAGIIPGTIILNFGDYPVTNLKEFQDAVAKVSEAKPNEFSAFCRVGARTGFYRIRPRWNNGTTN
ncbi:MAG: PDZ domain-containing protein [Candidatus Hydrogenedentes bacterium]|nr:PDZ domain-containing protein [Candidatus Hydrogenedentota bacterium]